MFNLGLSKVFKKYRIANNRKKVIKNKMYFIEQLHEISAKPKNKRDMKEVCFYPVTITSHEDIKQNKLLLILSSENAFLCNGETQTDNTKVVEYQLKLKNISDHFYHECYCTNTDYEKVAYLVYSEINALLASTKATHDKKFKISPFFNFWHFNLNGDNWQMFECALDTDDHVLIKYKMIKKKHKNYCFNPSLLFGASKEKLQITFSIDDSFYYCVLRIPLVLEGNKQSLIAVS